MLAFASSIRKAYEPSSLRTSVTSAHLVNTLTGTRCSRPSGERWRELAEDIRIFGEYPKFMVHFTTVSEERPSTRMAECIRFRESQIAAIEVFVGRELAESFERTTCV